MAYILIVMMFSFLVIFVVMVMTAKTYILVEALGFDCYDSLREFDARLASVAVLSFASLKPFSKPALLPSFAII